MNGELSAFGPTRTFRDVRYPAAFGGKAELMHSRLSF
jgi:hypothetical protein